MSAQLAKLQRDLERRQRAATAPPADQQHRSFRPASHAPVNGLGSSSSSTPAAGRPATASSDTRTSPRPTTGEQAAGSAAAQQMLQEIQRLRLAVSRVARPAAIQWPLSGAAPNSPGPAFSGERDRENGRKRKPAPQYRCAHNTTMLCGFQGLGLIMRCSLRSLPCPSNLSTNHLWKDQCATSPALYSFSNPNPIGHIIHQLPLSPRNPPPLPPAAATGASCGV